MSEGPKFPLADAEKVGTQLLEILAPACDRICIAGSVRRRRPEVGDVEILYIPRLAWRDDLDGGLFPRQINVMDEILGSLVESCVLSKRLNSKGHETWGEKIKLARHEASGIPVDFFATNPGSWANYLVCRTGPAESNTLIAMKAKEMGLKWQPYSSGFSGPGGRVIVKNEREVFVTVGLPLPRHLLSAATEEGK